MQERDFVEQTAPLSARLNRIERWQEQWRTRNRKVAGLQADSVRASGGYLVAPGRGLCANRHVEHTSANTLRPAGWNILFTIEPHPGYHSFLPVWWQIPATLGDVEPGVVFVFSDDTVVDRRNSGATNLEERHPLNLLFFKDGVSCKRVEFGAYNSASISQSQTLDTFKFQGWEF